MEREQLVLFCSITVRALAQEKDWNFVLQNKCHTPILHKMSKSSSIVNFVDFVHIIRDMNLGRINKSYFVVNDNFFKLCDKLKISKKLLVERRKQARLEKRETEIKVAPYIKTLERFAMQQSGRND